MFRSVSTARTTAATRPPSVNSWAALDRGCAEAHLGSGPAGYPGHVDASSGLLSGAEPRELADSILRSAGHCTLSRPHRFDRPLCRGHACVRFENAALGEPRDLRPRRQGGSPAGRRYRRSGHCASSSASVASRIASTRALSLSSTCRSAGIPEPSRPGNAMYFPIFVGSALLHLLAAHPRIPLPCSASLER